MARTERCSECGVQLGLPSEAKAFRCSVCSALTPVRPVEPLVLAHSQVGKAKNWFKGLMNQVTDPVNVNASSMKPQVFTAMPSNGYNPMTKLPRYPSAYGKKRALLIGVSYRYRRYELRGSVNDVFCMKYLLCNKFGFTDDCILVLTEDEKDPHRIPTKQNIQMAMQWLVHGCQPGDSLLFHYSGHGSQQIDFKGDEIDHFDETICPLDYESQGMIVDDEINATIVRPLPHGVKLHAIIDSCHSGTVLDLPFVCKMHRNGLYEWENHSPRSGVYKGTNGGFVVAFSGCADSQTSQDTSALSGTVSTGAMTFCFIQAVERESGATYGRMLNAMRTAISRGATGTRAVGPITSALKRMFCSGLIQKPQLSSSEKFDIYRKQFTL